MKPTRVLVVDDSALIRQMLTQLLSSDPTIEVVGVAPDAYIAREKIKSLNPDVITLDVDMPRMSGLDFLQKIMTLRPTPVVMVSSLTQKGAEVSLQALELGAVDCVAKPVLDTVQAQAEGLAGLREELIAKIKSAAEAQVRGTQGGPSLPSRLAALRDSARLARLRTEQPGQGWVIAMGASTGGVEALNEILPSLPDDMPPVLVTQHMPRLFTAAFAQRLDRRCAITVKEAEDGETVLPGFAYIAPGDRHLELGHADRRLVCRLYDGEKVSGHCPSVDVLFRSVAREVGGKSVGVILTGMGKDGAAGLLAMRRQGARTIGEAEASCVVYGMPKAAREMGGVEMERPLGRIAEEILGIFCGEGSGE